MRVRCAAPTQDALGGPTVRSERDLPPDVLAAASLRLDALRRVVLRNLGPLARPFVRSRALRSSTRLTLSVLVALALTAWAPLALLALAPLVLGVPHLAADVRILVVRTGLARARTFGVGVVPWLALAAATGQLAFGFVGVAIAALVASREPLARRGVAIATTLLALGTAFTLVAAPRWAAPAVAQLHNVVALALFVAWPTLRPQRGARREPNAALRVVPVLAAALALGAIGVGALDFAILDAPERALSDGFGTSLAWHAAQLAPPSLDPRIEIRAVLAFAFAQSVHYGAWLHALPDEDRDAPTPRSLHAGLVALRREGAGSLVVVTLVLGALLALTALVDVLAARVGYLRFAAFHGPLELAVLAHRAVAGRFPAESR